MSTTTSASHSNKSLNAFLTLALGAGLFSCGPAPSDHASSLTSPAGVSDAAEVRLSSETGSPRTAPAADPAQSAPDRGASGTAVEPLVVPDWMAQSLASPEVQVRLKALDLWAQQGPEAPLDPLVVALDDEDEQVRAKAMELFERAWVREQKMSE